MTGWQAPDNTSRPAALDPPDDGDTLVLPGFAEPPADPPAGDGSGGAGDDQPRRLVSRRSQGDRVFRGVLRGAGLTVLGITGLIAVFLVVKATGALHDAGWGFFTKKQWIPSNHNFGIATILPDGVLIALIALLVAVPVGVGAAVFISEYAPTRLRSALIALVDLMAAVPSIVYALWGVYFLQNRMPGPVRWIADYLSFLPFLGIRGDTSQNSSLVASTFIAGLVVSLMVIPIVTAICREVFSQAPAGEREGAYALGSSRWGMVRTVVLPYGRGGIIGAVMLGFGRAMGETIAVALIVSPTYEFSWRVLENRGNSIPALIADKATESTPDMLAALMAAGLVLFVVTLVVNALASIVVSRSRSGAQTG